MNQTLFPTLPVLLVDDESAFLRSFSLILKAAGITNIVTQNDSRQVMEMVCRQRFCVVVLDLVMPHFSGEELLEKIVSEDAGIPVIVLTGLDQVETAVSCMKKGAYDFLTKVSGEERLVSCVRRAVDLGTLRQENRALKKHLLADGLEQPEVFAEVITRDRRMQKIFRYMEALKDSSEAVLITGETGTGKELVAKAMHRLWGRQGRFVAVNAAGLDEWMFSDTLFGHGKGAFTGAGERRAGLIEQAAGGTLFLDEIGDLSIVSQVKLLRLVQEREYLPLGSDQPRRTDARLLFATHLDLQQLLASGRFRKDLFFRLQTHHIHLPLLKERVGDLEVLLDFFVEQAAAQYGKNIPAWPRELLLLLKSYPFPGNVRELRQIVFDAVSQQNGRFLSMDSFRDYIRRQRPDFREEETRVVATNETPFSVLEQLPTLKESSRLLVDEALRRAGGNQGIAADLLGITRQGLNWRLRQAGRDTGDDRAEG